MAPLPHNNTDILYVDYSTGDADHTVEMRNVDEVSVETGLLEMAALFDAVSPALSEITILGARLQESGSDVSNPVPWPGDATYGSGAGDHQNEASFIAFVGRSPDGRRVRISIYGYGNTNNLSSFRLARGADAVTDAALDVIEAGEGTFLSISGERAVWKQYSNIGISGYWQRQFR